MKRTFSFIFIFFLGAASVSAFVFYRAFYVAYSRAIAASVQKSLVLTRLIDAHYREEEGKLEVATLLFVGDMLLADPVEAMMREKNDFSYPFKKSLDSLKSADFLFGNLETTVSSRGKSSGAKYSFRASSDIIDGLVEAGFDGVSLANNHIWDWGVSALLDTASSLKSAGITPVGAGANEDQANGPLIAAAGQAKIALVAYTPFFPKELEAQPQSPGVSHFDKAKMLETVSYLRRIADAVVVSLHWGEEYQMSADDEQKNLARDLIDAGADIIIGHHPHVRQEVEHYKNGYIAYSLGNFVSGINPNEEALRGYAVKVIMKGRRIANIQALDVLNSGSEMQPEIIGN